MSSVPTQTRLSRRGRSRLKREPALILVAGYDPLRDEGVDYAKRLIEAGNRVTLVNYEGMVHGFLLMGGAIDAANRALLQSAATLRRVFGEMTPG